MPIRPPALDDRRFDDLVAELVGRIPAHTPEWTNPRVGDPGRTLIELFAWLGDALLYRVNLIPERQRLAFLRLLGQPLLAAHPARGLVSVSLKENEPVAAYSIRPPASFIGPVTFEVRDEFTVLPVTASAYYKRPAASNEVAPQVLQGLAQFHLTGGTVKAYVTTPLFVENRPSPDGFDFVADTVDRCLWLALFAPKAGPGATQQMTNADVVAKLGQSSTGGRQLLNIGFVPALPVTDALESVTAPARIPHVWEITVNTSKQSPWQPEYLALDEVADSTAGLRRQGIVRVALPRSEIMHAPENDVRLDQNAGVGDRPPRLDDEVLAARLVAWIRLRPATAAPSTGAPETQFSPSQPAAPPPSATQALGGSAVSEVEHMLVTWLGANVLEIEQLVTRSNLVIGESTGAPDQEFQLPATDIEPETLRLEIEGDSGWAPWQRIEDLVTLDRDAAASRDAPVFELDPAEGTVRFGDGIRGRIPPVGRRIRTGLIRSGGGAIGNLPAGTLKSVSAITLAGESAGSHLVVVQPMTLTGGADSETLADAEKRIPSRLQHQNRAVTADDYRSVARETPGVAVGRVELLPRFKPQQRNEDIPGIVTLMALPERPLGPAPNPRADRPFLEAIYGWVDGRRPLGTEFYVIGCEYVPVAVSVGVTVAEGAAPETSLQAVKESLIRVLWPLAGGGFDQQGWRLGRSLSNRELAVEVARVEGISEVAGLNLFRRDAQSGTWKPIGDARDGREQNLGLERWQLPELLGVTVVAANSAPLSVMATGVNPFADPNAVAVPIVPDIC
jgi:predicted phage baseplate assembly protein